MMYHNDKNGPNCSKATLIKFIEVLFNRLFPNTSTSDIPESDAQIPITRDDEQNSAASFELQLKMAIETAAAGSKKNEEVHLSKSLIEKEFQLFESTGKRTPNLESLYKAVKPTSTRNEHVFSLSGNIVSKIRNRLSDTAINALIFLKAYFITK